MVSVAVLIPTYNRVAQTVRAVKSVLAQSYPADQIIVVDDGSSYGCYEELRAGLADYPVTLERIDHTGHPGRVRDAGLRLVKASHVAFLDSDDQWVPGKLELQVAFAKKGFRAQGSGYLIDSLEPAEPLSNDHPIEFLYLKDLLKENQICNSSVLLERKLLLQVGGLPTSYGIRGIEDYVAWLRIATVSDWLYSPMPLVIYSDDPANSMRSTNVFSIPEQELAALDLFHWYRSHSREVPRGLLAMQKTYFWMQRFWLGRNGSAHK